MTNILLELKTPIDCAQRETLDAVYRRFGRAALSKLIHVVGREDVAKELLQEVFIKLWNKSPSFASAEMLYAWIYRACHNAGIDYLRSAVFRRECFEVATFQEDRASDQNLAEEVMEAQGVRKILQMFSKREAEIIAFIAFDEMTHEETAGMLGISKKTVTRTMARVKEILGSKDSFGSRGKNDE